MGTRALPVGRGQQRLVVETQQAQSPVEAAFVLHRRKFRETSLIVDLLTASGSRLAVVARGALRGKSALGGVMQPLLPISFEARGRGELLTLTRAEATGPALSLAGERLYAVFYLNEILIKLTVAGDPVPGLFEHYRAALEALAADRPLEPVLRHFEIGLLQLIGLGLNLEMMADSGELRSRHACATTVTYG